MGEGIDCVLSDDELIVRNASRQHCDFKSQGVLFKSPSAVSLHILMHLLTYLLPPPQLPVFVLIFLIPLVQQ